MPVARASAAPLDLNLQAILFLLLGVLAFAVQDVIVKLLSGDYAIHQIVLIRGLGAAPVALAALLLDGSLRRGPGRIPFGLLTLRSLLNYLSYSLWYLAIAAMQIADALAIGFVAPLLITGLATLYLGARVSPGRWLAILAGFVGTLVMLRPGLGVFEPAALLVLAGSACYSVASVLTRKMAADASSAAMALHGILVACLCSGLMGWIAGDGHLATGGHPSAEFMLRAWSWPDTRDLLLMLTTGLSASIGMLAVAQAYRIGQPATVAPFEYTGMIWALIAGYLFWSRIPDAVSLAGIALIVGAGVYLAILEGRQQAASRAAPP